LVTREGKRRSSWGDFAYMMAVTLALSLAITLIAYGLGWVR